MKRFLPVVLLISGLAWVGCGVESTQTVKTLPVKLEVPAEMDEQLSAADLLDGKADKTISKCYSCALHMDGKPEFSVEVNGYTAHFCTERCSQHFASETEKVINDTAVETPEDDSTDVDQGEDEAAE